ncbi:uncharacterized protein LOC103579876 [Microplitis demolitor]|uniref:uncharacterized protein LOC103579876 n=1 Tax=Microplitis demolitor TaxID=69319 RepID=UPI0004CCBD13|nr:uncharacterized protein LOC103579876 [Microplitis demolitor]
MTCIFLIACVLVSFAAAQEDLYEQHPEYPSGLNDFNYQNSYNYRWMTIKYVGIRFPDSVIVTEENGSNYYGCVGVPVSKKHVLIARSCRIDLSKSLVAVAAGAVDWDQENSYRRVEKVDKVGDYLAVVTLQNKITENIQIFTLPSSNIQIHDVYESFGWSSMCPGVMGKNRKGTFDKLISIVDQAKCGTIDPTLACAQDSSRKIGKSSPIVNGRIIVGFTEFECSSKGGAIKVFPFVNHINNIIKNN